MPDGAHGSPARRELTLVSSCLAGLPCRYDGRAKPDPTIVQAVREGRAVPACAEQLGGLPTPRPAAEIVGGDGHDVLAGRARVLGQQGKDFTEEFISGAHRVAAIAAEHGITRATLQARSPSCGAARIYDGSHSGTLVAGDGVLAALLRSRGMTIEAIRGRIDLEPGTRARHRALAALRSLSTPASVQGRGQRECDEQDPDTPGERDPNF